jgi:hypothetical protein
MIDRARLIQSAIALAAVVAVALVAELAFADTDHYDSALWGSTVVGLWAAIGLVGAIALVALATGLTKVGVARDEDPYQPTEESDG